MAKSFKWKKEKVKLLRNDIHAWKPKILLSSKESDLSSSILLKRIILLIHY